MSSRYSAARPKRPGEAYARSRQQDDQSHSSPAAGPGKKVKFDVRNPSTLAPDAPEDDLVLEADVIGKGYGATKRGAVNIEGYDSDSDNENFDARARQRNTGDVDLLKQLDNYDAKGGAPPAPADEDEDDEDEDMFAPDDDDKEKETNTTQGGVSNKKKSVSFLEPEAIQGAEDESKSGGVVHLGSDDDSDGGDDNMDEAIPKQGLDEEIGLGGLKHHAPKLEAFNMNEEQEEGRFDQEGNYVRKAIDPDAVHDVWLQGVSKKEMKKAAEAHESRQAELRKARLEDDRVTTSELLTKLITRLERTETPLEALVRLGKSQKKKKKEKKVPKWKLKKQKAAESMDVDEAKGKEEEWEGEEDPEQVRIKQAIDAITESADRLMGRDRPDIYDRERELLVREYRKETDEDWVEPESKEGGNISAGATMWEYRWTDGRDGSARQGPYDGPTMKSWQDAGYFSEGIEFRQVSSIGDWNTVVSFV